MMRGASPHYVSAASLPLLHSDALGFSHHSYSPVLLIPNFYVIGTMVDLEELTMNKTVISFYVKGVTQINTQVYRHHSVELHLTFSVIPKKKHVITLGRIRGHHEDKMTYGGNFEEI